MCSHTNFKGLYTLGPASTQCPNNIVNSDDGIHMHGKHEYFFVAEFIHLRSFTIIIKFWIQFWNQSYISRSWHAHRKGNCPLLCKQLTSCPVPQQHLSTTLPTASLIVNLVCSVWGSFWSTPSPHIASRNTFSSSWFTCFRLFLNLEFAAAPGRLVGCQREQVGNQRLGYLWSQVRTLICKAEPHR